MRKIIIGAVWLVGMTLTILPYFVGKTISQKITLLQGLTWPYLWSLGCIVCLTFLCGALFVLALWPISDDIADHIKKRKSK